MTLRVGLSGGIGSGKSTVSAHLASLGAVVVDADAVAREVVEPGTPGLAQIEERFGPSVIASDGSLDRPALGRVVFGEEQARRDLEAITHPLIARRTAQIMEGAPEGAVVVHDIPLLVELGRAPDYALAVVVDVPEAERLRRLVKLRGMDEQAARSRIRAQADDAQRRAAADVLLDNATSLDRLRERVDDLWSTRLVPFRDHLRDGIPGGPGGRASAADTERLRARVEAALGRRLERAAAPPGQAGDGGARYALAPGVLDEPEVRRGLRQRGLVVVDDDAPAAPVPDGPVPEPPVPDGLDEVTVASADPMSTARLRLLVG
ncbi:dephospho-CoA kinase [uncultured Serinicoccus sp.]|uniref:dephospho-CoA kinase n=1 Tax=uncultured Serinicoccus sp. TaxID=735514 RepID=UPI00261EA360|nr:dephospho-CoA kinase [uncultured Serinicoccus sp.]